MQANMYVPLWEHACVDIMRDNILDLRFGAPVLLANLRFSHTVCPVFGMV